MSGFSPRDNEGFLRDADFLLIHSEWVLELVRRLRHLSGKSTERRSAYKEIAAFISDFGKEPQEIYAHGHLHLSDLFKGLVSGNAKWPLAPLLAWFCYYHHEEAGAFYEDSGLYAKVGERPRRYIGTPGTLRSKTANSRAAVIAPQTAAPPPPDLHLSLPPLSTEPLHFSNRLIPEIFGRGDEQAALREFVDAGSGFRWLQIAGEGGQGKSRLAYELTLELGSKWRTGILHKRDLGAFQAQWRTWHPSKPHLIIIDYLIGHEAEIGEALKTLASRQGSEGFAVPVCVLLIERQRWDRGGTRLSASTQRSDRADWFTKLNAAEGDDLTHGAFCHGSGVIELGKLSSNDLVRIIRIICGQSIPYSDAALAKMMAKLDQAGRPLYACLLGQLLADEHAAPPENREQLLTRVLQRDRDRRWPAIFKPDKSPTLADDHPALRLSLLATMIGRVDCHTIPRTIVADRLGDAIIRQAIGITSGNLSGSMMGGGTVVEALPPDILGEWFVLSAIDHGPLLEWLADAAWTLAPKEMLAFLYRSFQDCPDHPSVLKLLSHCPSETAQAGYSAWSGVVALILSRLLHRLPDHLTQALYVSAESGDATAMHNLGVYLINGKCAPQSEETGLSWLTKAANTNSPASMQMIAMCYIEGIGAEQNFELGADWLDRAAKLNDAAACRDLGMFKLTGFVVEMDEEGGLELLDRAARKEDGAALCMLGQWVEQNSDEAAKLEQAFDYFQRSADAGDDGGMFHLARCFEHGIGTDQNLDLATSWYQRSAELGNEDAHFWWAKQF